jgi:hypothetical protein
LTLPRRPYALALLFAGAALFSALTMLNGIQPNDEGLMLQAAARIADGQVPYSDFWWFYPPGQSYLLGGLWDVFGPSLLVWRIVRVLVNAAVVVLVYVLARRLAPRGISLAASFVACGAMAFPSGPHPFPIVMALALGALLCLERPAWCGVLVGVAAVWRIEFAVYLGLGVLIADAVRPGDDRGAIVGRFLTAAFGVAVLLYTPVVIAAGFGDSWDLLVDYPLTDFSDYQTLPFPLDYDGILNTSSIGGFFSDSFEEILHFYLPLALVLGLVGSLGVLALKFDRSKWQLVAPAVLGIGAAHYLVTRPDIFHTAPLAVMVSVLGAWAIAGSRGRGVAGSRGKVRGVGAALAVLALVYAGAEGTERFLRGVTEDTVALDVPAADGVRVKKGTDRALEDAVAFVRREVPADRPIYVMPKRADLVTSGHPLFYVLADRRNAARYDIAAPGVVTSAPVQREIIRDLERAGRPLVMRWIDPITAAPEPNAAGKSSGVTLLDDYLNSNYRETARFGNYVMLESDQP